MDFIKQYLIVFTCILLSLTFHLQYKFIVDGEWRHDDRQPSISSNLGTVNTILLTRESDYRTTMLSPQGPSAGPGAGSSMDVDNDAFQRVVWCSGTHV